LVRLAVNAFSSTPHVCARLRRGSAGRTLSLAAARRRGITRSWLTALAARCSPSPLRTTTAKNEVPAEQAAELTQATHNLPVSYGPSGPRATRGFSIVDAGRGRHRPLFRCSSRWSRDRAAEATCRLNPRPQKGPVAAVIRARQPVLFRHGITAAGCSPQVHGAPARLSPPPRAPDTAGRPGGSTSKHSSAGALLSLHPLSSATPDPLVGRNSGGTPIVNIDSPLTRRLPVRP